MSEPDIDIERLARGIESRIAALTSRTTGAMRELRRELSAEIASLPGRDVVRLALRMLEGESFVNLFLAYELVHHHRGALASLGRADLEALGRRLDSWWSVDIFGCFLSGPAWREGQITDKAIGAWARSGDRWWRRAAIVSTIALNNKARGGRGDIERTLATCELLLDDRDDMVEKAISWSLRELTKRDPDAVRAFIERHDDRLAARVRREVRHKLSTGLKNPRRKMR